MSGGVANAPPAGSERGRFVLLFSGGLDSTLEVVARLEEFREAHLLTFDNGYCINTAAAGRRAAELSDLFGADRVHHRLVHTRDLIGRILQGFRDLWREYRSPLIFDMGCKMAAVAELIRDASEHGVRYVADASSVDQTQVFIQHPRFREHIDPCVERWGLRFLEPVLFDTHRDEKTRRLEALGFDPGSAVLERLHITSQLRRQPFCLVGFSTFFFTSPLRKLPVIGRYDLPLERAEALWDRLWPRAEAYLAERLGAAPADTRKAE